MVFLIMIWSPNLWLLSFLVHVSWIAHFSICAFLRWHIFLQLSIWSIGRIMSRTITNWPGIFRLFRWYIDRTAKATAANIHIKGSASYIHVSCRLYVGTRFPNNWFIISLVVFACELPGDYGWVLIPYSCYIKKL